MSVEEGRNVQSLADQVRLGLDTARGTALTGDTKTAQGQLDLALSGLTALEAYLRARGVE
jgi:hypothetical protein